VFDRRYMTETGSAYSVRCWSGQHARPLPEEVAVSAPAALRCPKGMTFGPCGGVRADATCEAADHPCVFLDAPLPIAWPAAWADGPAPFATAAAREVGEILARRPLVMTGFPARPLLSADVAPVAAALAGSSDAVLSGDAGSSRTQYPPSYRAALMAREGVRVWMGVNARDRNRVALEGELAALADVGVAGVHCVTGDHTLSGDRPDAQPVFDLESTTMLPLARRLGLTASFAESPAAPPIAHRGERVREKQRAGGQLCLTQYAGDAAEIAAFVAACRAAGSDVPVLPGVPLVIDREGLELIASFPAAALPAGFAAELDVARDLRAGGIRLAVRLGRELLALDGVAGVVVAGGWRRGDELRYARALAEVAAELGGGS
jgi:methylenetetrahydrofolate reductase (NADPH)